MQNQLQSLNSLDLDENIITNREFVSPVKRAAIACYKLSTPALEWKDRKNTKRSELRL
jgi:hypothetical protein